MQVAQITYIRFVKSIKESSFNHNLAEICCLLLSNFCTITEPHLFSCYVYGFILTTPPHDLWTWTPSGYFGTLECNIFQSRNKRKKRKRQKKRKREKKIMKTVNCELLSLHADVFEESICIAIREQCEWTSVNCLWYPVQKFKKIS